MDQEEILERLYKLSRHQKYIYFTVEKILGRNSTHSEREKARSLLDSFEQNRKIDIVHIRDINSSHCAYRYTPG